MVIIRTTPCKYQSYHPLNNTQACRERLAPLPTAGEIVRVALTS